LSDAQPITGCRPGDLAPNVFLCGDPARVERISQDWDSKREVCCVREFTIVTGEKDGVPLSAASHGIGAPSTAVLVEELVKLGTTTMIRIGNSGGLDPDLDLGDLVITTGSVRDDGTSKTYVVPEFPAVADWEIHVGPRILAEPSRSTHPGHAAGGHPQLRNGNRHPPHPRRTLQRPSGCNLRGFGSRTVAGPR